MDEISTWTVSGMTCSHCVASVTEEVGLIAGVKGVDVALDSGLVTVISEQLLDPAQMAQAIEEAGYVLL